MRLSLALLSGVFLACSCAAPQDTGEPRYLLAFPFLESPSSQALTEIDAAFEALQSELPGINGAEQGLLDTQVRAESSSAEGGEATHSYMIEFASEAARAECQDQPALREFRARTESHLAEPVEMDMYAGP